MNNHLLDNDDLPVGRILSRREILTLFGVASGALLVASCAPIQPATLQLTAEATATAANAAEVAADTTAAPSCVVRPELTEGPYFVDQQLNRSDIRVNSADGVISEGVPLVLTFNVAQVSGGVCSPLPNAQVDIWHCDALGVYSGVANTPGDFLRGYQLTDANGMATFTTIYPGWYRGRAVHIHFKIRLAASTAQVYEFTSQFFFADAFSDQIYTLQPYASQGQRDQLNSTDGIYQQSGGQLLLAPVADGDGYAAKFDIALDLSDTETGATDSGGGRPRSGG